MMLEKRLLEAQSTLKNRIRELVIPLFIFILTAFGVLIYGINESAQTQDRLDVENSEKLLAALLADHNEHLQGIAFDYSYWGDTLQNLVFQLNLNWANENLGSYLFDLHDIAGSYVIDAENHTKYAVESGQLVETDFLREFPIAKVYFDSVRRKFVPGNLDSTKVKILKDVRGIPYFVTVSVIHDHDIAEDAAEGFFKHLLVLTKRLDGAFLKTFSSRFNFSKIGIHQVRGTVDPIKGYYPLQSVDGEVIGWLSWFPELHSGEMVHNVIRSTFLIVLGLIALMFYIGYRAVALNRVIDDGIKNYFRDRQIVEQYEETISELGKGPPLYELSVSEAFNTIANNAMRILGVNQVGLWDFDDDTRIMTNVACFDDKNSTHQVGVSFPIDDYPELDILFEEGFPACIKDVWGNPVLGRVAEVWFEPGEDISLLVIPVRRQGREKGFVHFAVRDLTFDWIDEKKRFAISLVDFVSLILDMQTQKEIEIELRRAKNMAEKANVAKTDFLANMSHELRTPLNAIIGFSDLIKQQIFGSLGTPKYDDYIQDINMSARHLLSLINEILDVAKTESGTYHIYPAELQLREELDTCKRLIIGRFPGKDMEVIIHVDPEIDIVKLDPKALRQIILNLMTNAVKFTGKSCAVVIDVKCLGAEFQMSIADNGIGIAKEELAEIYKPFRQIENAMNKRFDGTGLGLSITKALIELHGGRIAIESEVDVGTRVVITMPVRVSSDFIDGTGEAKVGNLSA